ncbi:MULTISPECIES: hypothetical protein [Streptomyces]|uniref:DUF308 domain-containing protein n=1 Tax=Streptomyces lonegramiae TaxID=3075524 RepID=A0ABU2XEC3_9ACTN|nr:hypothetical protein [Streptomyces sp. DSM 41529]MDT0544263.1 hypothetical protein [Streptomyces sp. DSM 41529]
MAERDPNENEAGARDDDAAFAEIVAAYGKESRDPEAPAPWPEAEDLPDGDSRDRSDRDARDDEDDEDDDPEGRRDPSAPVAGAGAGPVDVAKPDKPLGSFIVYAPGVGPRDWEPAEPSDDDFDETDEGHFVPPEPPPLPETDTTSRFAWLGVLGGPLLLLGVVLFQVELTWWITTLAVGGFLGGFTTLVLRMGDDDEEDDDPGRGAVV